MSDAIDKIMRAIAKKYQLTDEQSQVVRQTVKNYVEKLRQLSGNGSAAKT